MDSSERPLWIFRLTSGVAARLGPLSLALFVVSIAAYAAVARRTLESAPIPYLITILTPFVVLVGHEALHGLGFLVFGGRPKFGAGIKGAAPYLFATCPGKRFNWGHTLVVGALPLVAIDVAAFAFAGYAPLVVPAMLAFAFNTAGAVGDLWLIALILQTHRSAMFEDTDQPAMIAWPGPGTPGSARPPRGLDPRGFESLVTWASVATIVFLAVFLIVGIIEVALARASSNGSLEVGNVVLASVTATSRHLSVRVSLLPESMVAAVIAAALTLAARAVVNRTRRRRAS